MVDGSSCFYEQIWACFFLPSVSLSSNNNNVLVQRENFCLHNTILKNEIFFNILTKNEKKSVQMDLIVLKKN